MIFAKTWNNKDAEYLIREISGVLGTNLLNDEFDVDVNSDFSRIISLILTFCIKNSDLDPDVACSAVSIAKNLTQNYKVGENLQYSWDDITSKCDLEPDGEFFYITVYYEDEDKNDSKNFLMKVRIITMSHIYEIKIEPVL